MFKSPKDRIIHSKSEPSRPFPCLTLRFLNALFLYCLQSSYLQYIGRSTAYLTWVPGFLFLVREFHLVRGLAAYSVEVECFCHDAKSAVFTIVQVGFLILLSGAQHCAKVTLLSPTVTIVISALAVQYSPFPVSS